MSVFEYTCLQCSHTFRAFHKESSSSYTICPCCGKKSLQKKAMNEPQSEEKSQDSMMSSSC